MVDSTAGDGMKLVFWLLIVANVAVVGVLFVLGLAAAQSARTSGWAVAGAMLLVPGLLLGGAIALFTCTSAQAWRVVALLLAATPWLALVFTKGLWTYRLAASTDAQGNIVHFRAGPMRDLAGAIVRDDEPAIRALAREVDLNAKGPLGMTLLLHAIGQLERTSRQTAALRTLLELGANPNLGTEESPLQAAIQRSRHTGPEPVALLLAAGADPNQLDHFGAPDFFMGTGLTVDVAVLKLLLDRGANLGAKDRQGRTVLFRAATTANWKAVLLLLERGAEWKQTRSDKGQTFQSVIESHARTFGDGGGLAEVLEYVRKH